MARIDGATNYQLNFNITTPGPIDSRMRVEHESDLITGSTWPTEKAPLYDGLLVTVIDTGDLWVLRDKTKYTDKTTGAGWLKVGGGLKGVGSGLEITTGGTLDLKLEEGDNITITEGRHLPGKPIPLIISSKNFIDDNSSDATGTTFSASAITAMLVNAGFSVEVMDSLPPTGDTHTIYMVPSLSEEPASGTTGNTKDEYLYIKKSGSTEESYWELIGTTKIDLSNLYKAGDNITIVESNGETKINAIGYHYDTTKKSFGEGSSTAVTMADGNYSHAEGSGTTAYDSYSHAEGLKTIASGYCSHSEGQGTSVNGFNSHAEGKDNVLNSSNSHIEGLSNISENSGQSHIENRGNITIKSDDSHAEGYLNTIHGNRGHVEGSRTAASGIDAHAEGYMGNYPISLPCILIFDTRLPSGLFSYTQITFKSYNPLFNISSSVVSGFYNKLEYYIGSTKYTVDCPNIQSSSTENVYYVDIDGESIDLKKGSIIVLYNDRMGARGTASHSEGYQTKAGGLYSHSEGANTSALGPYSHAEGGGVNPEIVKINGFTFSFTSASTIMSASTTGVDNVLAVDDIIFYNNKFRCVTSIVNSSALTLNYQFEESGSSVVFSKVTNDGTFAGGNHSHTEGWKTKTINGYGHAEGRETVAVGWYAHAEGFKTQAKASSSHAEGRGTQTLNISEHAQGSFNKSHSATTSFDGNSGNTLHSIGIGSIESDRKNAVEVMQNGDMYLIGVGGYSGNTLTGDTLQKVVNRKLESSDLKEGSNIKISNNTVSAIGYTFDTSTSAFTEGYSASATGEYSHAEGRNTSALGPYSHAEGSGVNPEIVKINGFTFSFTSASTIMSASTTGIENVLAVDDIIFYNNKFRCVTSIINSSALTLNYQFEESGSSVYFSKVSNDGTFAGGSHSHTEGWKTKTINGYGHAEGRETVAVGWYAHAEGRQTQAKASYTHAEGNSTIAGGISSHAEGSYTSALGNYSHTSGLGTKADKDYMTAIGKYNKTGLDNSLFSVGDGTNSANTSNAFHVREKTYWKDYSSRAHVNGFNDVYLGLPIGSIVMWAGPYMVHDIENDYRKYMSLPEGWALCNGAAINVKKGTSTNYDFCVSDTNNTYYYLDNDYESRGNYVGGMGKLLSVIGITYGYVGSSLSAITAVYLPNFQQRFPLGRENSNIPAETGGTSAVTLTVEQMPTHTHYLATDLGNNNLYPNLHGETQVKDLIDGGAGVNPWVVETSGDDASPNNRTYVKNLRYYADRASGYDSEDQYYIKNTGGSQAHNNMPPYLTVNFIIKYL